MRQIFKCVHIHCAHSFREAANQKNTIKIFKLVSHDLLWEQNFVTIKHQNNLLNQLQHQLTRHLNLILFQFST